MSEDRGLHECEVCHVRFPLLKDRHYLARDLFAFGLADRLRGQEAALYDAFDCPFCGCQNIISVRKKPYLIPEEE